MNPMGTKAGQRVDTVKPFQVYRLSKGQRIGGGVFRTEDEAREYVRRRVSRMAIRTPDRDLFVIVRVETTEFLIATI